MPITDAIVVAAAESHANAIAAVGPRTQAFLIT
jgi:hypothetical protein